MKKLMKSKGLLIAFIGLFFIAVQPQKAAACEIEFEITDNHKEIYDVGDVLVVKVVVTLTHRSCPVGIKKTKFTMKGLKILGTTEWTQKSTMVWTRKFKMKVVETEDGNLVFNAIRTCDIDGGFGALKLKSR